VVTYEFENVPVAPLGAITAPLLPHPRAGNRAGPGGEKTFVAGLGGRPAPFMAVDGAADLARAVEEIGAPGILKTRRDGYDGKGQWRIGAADAAALDLPPKPLIYEGFIRFFAEFSVILVRGADGTVHFWDSADNVHVNGILDTTTVPAPPRSSPRCRRPRWRKRWPRRWITWAC
jgi:5-(carboxyamino)imidazole ribonucleotide synthase